MSRNNNHKAASDWPPGERSPGEDCYWARFDYLKLRETLEAIVSAMEATAKDDQPAPVPEPESTLRLVVSNDRPETQEDPPAQGPEPMPA
ncbi:hypothetical protein [Methyloceanibacter sp.]|uniref:hypothetical protein n=1 Tax=Methyloceanibacter sp. TaxID=1965321 RepID=UPI003D6C7564